LVAALEVSGARATFGVVSFSLIFFLGGGLGKDSACHEEEGISVELEAVAFSHRSPEFPPWFVFGLRFGGAIAHVLFVLLGVEHFDRSSESGTKECA
jgi:hypothetical protein